MDRLVVSDFGLVLPTVVQGKDSGAPLHVLSGCLLCFVQGDETGLKARQAIVNFQTIVMHAAGRRKGSACSNVSYRGAGLTWPFFRTH